jgi:hypothetical protein
VDDGKRKMAEEITSQIIELTEQPGFLDTLGSPESLLQLNRFLKTPGIAGSPVARELAQFAPPEAAHLSAQRWKGIANKLRDFFLGHPIRVEAEELVWIPIEVHGLYCPAIPGSRASLSVDRGTKEKSSCSVLVFGNGGGHAFTIEFTVRDEFAVEAQSVVVRYLIQGTVAKCVIDAPGGPERFPRLEKLHKKMQRVEVQPVTPPGHQAIWGEVIFTREYDLRNAKVTNKFTLENAVESEWRGSAGLKLETLGFDVTIEYALTKKWKTIFTYELPAGHLFRAQVFASRCFVSAVV